MLALLLGIVLPVHSSSLLVAKSSGLPGVRLKHVPRMPRVERVSPASRFQGTFQNSRAMSPDLKTLSHLSEVGLAPASASAVSVSSSSASPGRTKDASRKPGILRRGLRVLGYTAAVFAHNAMQPPRRAKAAAAAQKAKAAAAAMDISTVSQSASATARELLRLSKHTWSRFQVLWSLAGGSIVPLFVLLFVASFFALSETAITALWPWKIEEMAMKEKGKGERHPLQMLRKDITRFLTTILIGGTLANILVASIITELSTQILGPLGTSVATAISTILIVLFCEITPKAIAVQHPESVLKAVVWPLSLITSVLYPLGHACTVICNQILRLFGVAGSVSPTVTELELRMVLEGAEDSGQVTDQEADMVENVLQLGDTTVESVMTPLVDVVAIDQNSTLADMCTLWKKFQYSRVPVYSDRIDNVVGLAFTKDILNYAEKPQHVLEKAKVRHIMISPPFFVPDSMIVRKLLQEFQTRKFHMAVVVNEYGGVAGVVTLEDVLEEIVGEIFDETDIDRPQGSTDIVRWGEGIWYAKGESEIDDVEEALGAEIPKGPHETIGGFVTRRFGRIPKVGESFEVKLNPLEEDDDGSGAVRISPRRYLFKVVSTNDRQVIEVRVDLLSDTNPRIPPSLPLPDSPDKIHDADNGISSSNIPSLPLEFSVPSNPAGKEDYSATAVENSDSSTAARDDTNNNQSPPDSMSRAFDEQISDSLNQKGSEEGSLVEDWSSEGGSNSFAASGSPFAAATYGDGSDEHFEERVSPAPKKRALD